MCLQPTLEEALLDLWLELYRTIRFFSLGGLNPLSDLSINSAYHPILRRTLGDAMGDNVGLVVIPVFLRYFYYFLAPCDCPGHSPGGH